MSLYKFYIPTFEECVKICEHNDAFKHKVEVIKGFRVHVFNYALASYGDFEDPIPGSGLKAYELRGITFVEDGEVYTRYLMLHKFFRLNQTVGYMYDDLKDLEIDFVQDKRDGSMIRFFRLPNGDVVAKTKFGFDNEQANEAQRLYDSDFKLKEYVDYTLDMKLAAIFEFTSPFNRIVLRYDKSELVLLQVRNEKTGDYRLSDRMLEKEFDVPVAEVFRDDRTLDDYIELAKTVTGIEGWVFTFKNGKKSKDKTKWYDELHRLLTEDLSREDFLIHSILGESIDDAVVALDKTDPMRDYIDNITVKLQHWFNAEVKTIHQKMLTYDGDRKTFAIANNRDPNFPIFMRMIGNSEKGFGDHTNEEKIDELLKEKIIKDTRRLELGRKFLQDIGITELRQLVEE